MMLAHWRHAAGKTQADVAAALGVVPLLVSQWETGRRRPNAGNMARIFEMTDGAVSANDFYDLMAQPESPAADVPPSFHGAGGRARGGRG